MAIIKQQAMPKASPTILMTEYPACRRMFLKTTLR
jgi:hypothetical protein